MAIRSIKYDNAFQIALDWPAGVRRTVVYSRPVGAGPVDEAELADAMANHRLKQLCSGYEYGTGTPHFSYAPEGMRAQWIEIYCCDFGIHGEAVRHECAGRFFNGSCKISYEVRRIPVAEGLEAVRLKVRNRSEFDLEAGGIGYAVGDRAYRIPVALRRNEERELPQFEVFTGAPVSVQAVDGGYPVRARLVKPGRDGEGE